MPILILHQPVRVKSGAIALTAVLSLASGAAFAQTSAPASPLTTAKTIQLKETFFVSGKAGKLNPYFAVIVQIERPGKVRIDVTPLFKQGDKPVKKSLYLSDGKMQYEYNGFTNQYTATPAPKPGERSTSQLCAMAAIQSLLYPGQPPPAAWHVARTVGKETLDGKERIVTTDVEPTRKGRDGVAYTPFTKLWTDAGAGLPYRKTDYLKAGDKTEANLQLDLTDYVFDQPIKPGRFVWAPPAGAEAYTEPKLLAVGTPAPDFSAVDPEGKTVHLSDFKGKTVVLDFWATWCGPCQASMPHLEKVYRLVKDKGVAVLAVCVWDEKPEYDKWIVAKKSTYTFQTAFDPAGRGAKSIAGALYQVAGIPTQYVIDKNGKVAAANVGYREGEAKLEVALKALGVDIAVPQKAASTK